MSANKGEVTYEIRADDAHLEEDLAEAEKKVKDSTERTAESTEEIEKRSSEAKKEIKEDETKHHQEQNQKQEEDVEKSNQIREESSKKHGDVMKNIASGTAKAIGAAFVAAGTAAVTVGTMAITGANDLDKAANQYVVSTGKSTEETQRYKDVLESIYVNNYGESFEDIADAMSQVDKQLGELSDEQLQQVTESAFALRDVFEYDVAESTRAAKAMMDNFGVSGEEAMNLIAAGAQNGLDYSGELLDSISEYSVQFAKLGYDADDMFQIFQKGADSGAWNLDKVGDAIKEFSIRAIDGSDATKKAFDDLGFVDLTEDFAAGGETAKEAFDIILYELDGMQDKVKQNEIGVALFGTMWEDLGPEVISQLKGIGDAAYATGEELNGIKEVKYDDLGSMLDGLKRSVEVLLIPLGEQLIPVLSELIEEVLPLIEESLPPLLDLVMQSIESMLPIVEEILPILIDLIEEILPMVTDVISKVLPALIDLFTYLGEPLLDLISVLLPPLIDLFNALMPLLNMLISLLTPIIQLFIDLLAPILGIIIDAIAPLIEIVSILLEKSLKPLQEAILVLGKIFSIVLNGMFEEAGNIFNAVAKIFKGLIEFIEGVFSGDWERAWKGVVDIFDGIFSGLASLIKIPINWIIDGINTFLEGLNGIKIPDWVPVVGGSSFSISLIPRLKKGMGFVPSDYFPAYLDYGERVLTQQENRIYTALGGVEGMQGLKQSVNVTADGKMPEIDYDRIGEATAKALERSGLAVKIDKREIGRIVREVQN